MKILRSLSWCVALGVATTCWSADEVGTPIIIHTAEDAVALALERNAQLRAAQSTVAAARFRTEEFTAFARPQVRAGADVGLAGGTRNPQYEAGNGDQTRYGANGEITQYLFGFGRLIEIRKAAAASIQASEANAAEVSRDLARFARLSVADILFAREVMDIASKRVEQREGERGDAEALKAAGLIDGLDVIDSNIRVANAEEQLRTAQSAERLALESLADIINAPTANITVEGELVRVATLSELMKTVLSDIDSGSQLKRLDALQRQALATARGTKADRLPVISAFAGGDLRGNEPEDLDDGWSAGLRLDWAIYDGGAKSARASAANADAAALQFQYDAALRTRQAQAASLAERADDIQRRLTLKNKVLEWSKQLYVETRERYAAGTETLTRLNEINLTVFEAAFAVAELTYQEAQLAADARAFLE